MRFATVRSGDGTLAVALTDEGAIPLRGITELGRHTPLALLADPPLRADAGPLPGGAIERAATIPHPGKVICVGLNYRAHIEETGRSDSDYPVLFTKFASTLTGPHDDIPVPPESDAVDYEGELAVVIGSRARRVSAQDASTVIAGYTVANDVSMRDYQNKTHQWLPGKAWDSTTPLGPDLVTPDEVGDLSELVLRTTVNGDTMQEASLALLIFDVPTLIATISEFATLEPGDVILTGTPGGVGFRREPPRLLGDGDVVRVEIDRIGRIENRFVAEPAGG